MRFIIITFKIVDDSAVCWVMTLIVVSPLSEMRPSLNFDAIFPYIVLGFWFLVVVIAIIGKNLYFKFFPRAKHGLYYLRGFPFLGNFFISINRPHITITKFAKRYGDMFWMKVLGKDMLILSKPDAILQALNNNKLSGRPYIWRIDYGFHFHKDIIFGDGLHKWSYMKKIAATAMRKFQDSTLTIVEENMKTELAEMTKNFQYFASENIPFDPSMVVLTAVVNVVARTVSFKIIHHNLSIY